MLSEKWFRRFWEPRSEDEEEDELRLMGRITITIKLKHGRCE
jgi:hypothetical protein